MTPLSEKGRFDPLADDHWLVGHTCRICGHDLVVGQRPALVANGPANADEAAKRDAGGAYNSACVAVHEDCAYPTPAAELLNVLRKHGYYVWADETPDGPVRRVELRIAEGPWPDQSAASYPSRTYRLELPVDFFAEGRPEVDQ